MNSQQILELLKQYNLIEDTATLPDDWREFLFERDQTAAISELLDLFVNDKAVYYGDMAEGPGGGEYVDLTDPFVDIIKEYINASSGAITIDNLKTTEPENNFDIDEEIVIEFDHAGTHYKWAFNFEEPDDFYREVTAWAEKALDGNVLFIGDESFTAYCLPKAFIKELEGLGIRIPDAKNYFGAAPE
jgi:hypothetical protein